MAKTKSTKSSAPKLLTPPAVWPLYLIPFAVMLWVWLSPLAFVPVPWPDDSAFYFVAKELFKWPPRWVMLPQAPFEPTYRIFNFNTMPLYPILIGLGRLIGIDGSFMLKLWPLGAWALSGAFLVGAIRKAGLPALWCVILILPFALDPSLRWASVLIRPESLIGLFGMGIVLGLSLGFPKRLEVRKYWDPVAALLALGAYAHFNAVHLVFPVVLTLWHKPRRLVSITGHTLLYLSPWLLSVLIHLNLFVHQMRTQWKRLAVPNDWLSSPTKALAGLFQEMGSPIPLSSVIQVTSVGIWVLIFLALAWGFILPTYRRLRLTFKLDSKAPDEPALVEPLPDLVPAAGWVIGSIWLWNSKPEVWFTYYLHASVFTFAALAALRLWRAGLNRQFLALMALIAPITLIFAYVDLEQSWKMGESYSWKWSTYEDFVDCVDLRLTQLQNSRPRSDAAFKVWCPTFPDITIELSRRHTNWELTRTNDFWERVPEALAHGHEVDAVVVTESINGAERMISSPAAEHPEVVSVWMTWQGYFLNQLWKEPGWKPNRYTCQRGKWQGFIFMK